jgi:hypothetical protein
MSAPAGNTTLQASVQSGHRVYCRPYPKAVIRLAALRYEWRPPENLGAALGGLDAHAGAHRSEENGPGPPVLVWRAAATSPARPPAAEDADEELYFAAAPFMPQHPRPSQAGNGQEAGASTGPAPGDGGEGGQPEAPPRPPETVLLQIVSTYVQVRGGEVLPRPKGGRVGAGGCAVRCSGVGLPARRAPCPAAGRLAAAGPEAQDGGQPPRAPQRGQANRAAWLVAQWALADCGQVIALVGWRATDYGARLG